MFRSRAVMPARGVPNLRSAAPVANIAKTGNNIRSEAEVSDFSPGEAIYRQGVQYYDTKQYARAFAAFNEAAAAGHPSALRRLAYMYRYGVAVKKDICRAIELFELAVAGGDVYAKGYLGNLLIHGSSGYFLGGISQPRRVLRGLRLISSGLWDALLGRTSTTSND